MHDSPPPSIPLYDCLFCRSYTKVYGFFHKLNKYGEGRDWVRGEGRVEEEGGGRVRPLDSV